MRRVSIGEIIIFGIIAIGGLFFLGLLGYGGYMIYMNVSGKGSTPLHQAAKIGDLIEVQRLIEEGASIDQEDINGDTPLEKALDEFVHDRDGNQLVVAEYLINQGAEVTYDDLKWVILYDRLDLVELIVSRGIKPLPTSLAYYIDHIADGSRSIWNPKFADFFLESGADINGLLHDETCDCTFTALGFAIHYRNFSIVKYLVENGADVNAPMESGILPLALSETEYRINLDDGAGPGIHYYRVVEVSQEISDYLKQHGAQ
jgi:ankyrin repeat protein